VEAVVHSATCWLFLACAEVMHRVVQLLLVYPAQSEPIVSGLAVLLVADAAVAGGVTAPLQHLTSWQLLAPSDVHREIESII
jgi:hypothetical protein